MVITKLLWWLFARTIFEPLPLDRETRGLELSLFQRVCIRSHALDERMEVPELECALVTRIRVQLAI